MRSFAFGPIGLALIALAFASTVQATGAESVQILAPQDASFRGWNLTPAPPNDLTDWIKWFGNAPADAYHKADGGGMIGSFARIDTTGYFTDFDNSGTGTAHTGFSWTDSDTPASNTGSYQEGAVIFDPGTDSNSAGAGFQFTVFPGAGSGTVRFWGMSASADAVLRASVKSGSNITLASDENYDFTNPGGSIDLNYESAYYDINYSNFAANDKLVIQYAVQQDNGSSDQGSEGYVGLMAASLKSASPTPEPASLGLLGLFGAGMLLRRRR